MSSITINGLVVTEDVIHITDISSDEPNYENYYPKGFIYSFILPGLLKRYSGPAWSFLCRVYSPLDRCERIFMKMSNISNLTTQVTNLTSK